MKIEMNLKQLVVIVYIIVSLFVAIQLSTVMTTDLLGRYLFTLLLWVGHLGLLIIFITAFSLLDNVDKKQS